MRKKIGVFSAQLIEILELNIPAGAPIYIADSNIEHMKTFHPDDFAQYGSELSNIIANTPSCPTGTFNPHICKR